MNTPDGAPTPERGLGATNGGRHLGPVPSFWEGMAARPDCLFALCESFVYCLLQSAPTNFCQCPIAPIEKNGVKFDFIIAQSSFETGETLNCCLLGAAVNARLDEKIEEVTRCHKLLLGANQVSRAFKLFKRTTKALKFFEGLFNFIASAGFVDHRLCVDFALISQKWSSSARNHQCNCAKKSAHVLGLPIPDLSTLA